jgi:hypothetical protein
MAIAKGDYYWIIEVNGKPARWAWRGHPTSRGGLDMQAFRTRSEAKASLYEARRLYGNARLVKFVREAS